MIWRKKNQEKNTIRIHIFRDGICMGDDVLEHSFTIVLKEYDSIDIMGLFKIIDIWLIQVENVIWTVSLDEKVLGTIKIVNGEHSYEVSVQEPLRRLDFSKNVYCRHRYLE